MIRDTKKYLFSRVFDFVIHTSEISISKDKTKRQETYASLALR